MLGDTIHAVASPPGQGERGIVRISGPDALAVAARLLGARLAPSRTVCEASVQVLGFAVPCLVLVMPAPRSYTGEDVVELHLPGSPLLLDEVCRGLVPASRAASPGEFTRRAFENGRIDLAAAQAVLQLIHAAGAEESRFALDVLRGGLAVSVARLRSGIQEALALLELGLDFDAEETGAVPPSSWRPHLVAARQACAELRQALPPTSVGGELLLVGRANVGKSALANALAGVDRALVAPVPGTTRDVLAFEFGDGVRLLDGPGDIAGATAVEALALALRDRIAARVAGAIEVIDASAPAAVPDADADPARPEAPPPGLRVLARVYTKADLLSPANAAANAAASTGLPTFLTSSVTGAGIAALREFLTASGGGASGLGARIGAALEGVEAALARAIDGVDEGQPHELVALDLQDALDGLDAITGESSPEDVLDRIFAGFCLGK